MSETVAVSTSMPPGLAVPEAPGDQASSDKKKKKKAKVRSAWISFIGRILAQMCGAAATVILGLQLVRGYFPEQGPADAARAATEASAPALRRPAGMKVLAVLPVVNFSSDRQHDTFSDGLTEALIVELAQIPGVHITSRTSSMHFRDKAALLPSIARQLGVDFVLESSVVTSGDRKRITVQVIDAATDLHVWVRRYESNDRDVLAFLSTITAAIARDLRAAGIGHEEE